MRYKLIYTILSLALLISGCEKNIVEEELVLSYPEELGFTDKNSVIILHNQSVSYYNAKEHKVYGGLFEHINGRKLGQKLQIFKTGYYDYSYIGFSGSYFFGYIGAITIPEANKVEFVKLNNFNSLGSFTLSGSPVDCEFMAGYALVSCDATPGYLSIIDYNSLTETDKIYPDFNPGKLLRAGDEIYVMSKPGIQNDTIINTYVYDISEKFVMNGQIEVGYNPIDMIKSENYLAVLCEGKKTFENEELTEQEPGCIVIYDYINKKIESTAYFANIELIPSALFNLDYEANYIEFYRNNKLYRTSLDNVDDQTRLISNPVKSLIIGDYIWGLSVNNDVDFHSWLYQFQKEDYTLIDSIRLDSSANMLVNFNID